MDTSIDRVTNPFGGNGVAPRVTGALAEAEQQRAIAETQASMILAKRFPRDVVAAMDKILNACTRPSLAEGALYEYARGGTAITGPSIRLAEALAQNWGNIQFGIRELSQQGGVSEVEAFAWDIETNTRQTKTFQVRHVRHTRNGQNALTDPRDIYEMVANQGARRLRACILGVIPGDVVEAAVSQCEKTLNTKADTSPEYMKKVVTAFGEFGVTVPMIEKRIQRRIDAIQPAQVLQLRKIMNSLKDGMSSPGDWFEMTPPEEQGAGTEASRTQSVGAKLRGRAQAAQEPAPSPHQAQQDAAEVTTAGTLGLDDPFKE
jgi:hypothetical protein